MSRKDLKAKGKGSNLPPFKPMFNYVFKCAAFKALTPVERSVYIEIKMRYQGDNNGSIYISTREIGEAINRSKSTASRAILRLEELGFIAVETPSGFNRKDRTAAEYRLTEHPNDLPGRPKEATRDFMRWRKDLTRLPARQQYDPLPPLPPVTNRHR